MCTLFLGAYFHILPVELQVHVLSNVQLWYLDHEAL